MTCQTTGPISDPRNALDSDAPEHDHHTKYYMEVQVIGQDGVDFDNFSVWIFPGKIPVSVLTD